MCGICGFVNYRNDEILKKMTAMLYHRGPDEDGYFTCGDASLGVRRLKIIDLYTGSQPIFNEDKSIVVVYNGEIYNFLELRNNLILRGHKFYTNTDTEVIVHTYEEYGDDCVKYFEGMFAFALWDKKQKKLLLARDQFGIKPLYYSKKEDKLFFASEIKSLLINYEISREIDYSAIDDYLTLCYIPHPKSPFKHIKKLPPATILTFQDKKIHLKKYFEVPEYSCGSYQAGDLNYYTENIFRLLKESIIKRKMSDVPVGVFLSGGLDSSTIVAFLSMYSGEQVKTFTVGYTGDNKSFDETEKARKVARIFNCEHYEYILEPDIAEVIIDLTQKIDEPFADSSAIPTYLISKSSRQTITVALTGIGGDEIFAGYPRYLGAYLLKAYFRLPEKLRKMFYLLFKNLPETRKARNIPGWIKRFVRGGLFDFRSSYISWITYLNQSEKEKFYTDSLKEVLAGEKDIAERLFGNFRSPEDLFPNELNTYLTDDLLFLADRTSMLNSLELRVPFLDGELVKFMSQVPLALKIKNLRLKYLLRKMLRDKLPGEIVSQRKMGFQVPLGDWLVKELQPLIFEYLSKDRIRKRGLFNPEYVHSIFEEHISGRRNLSDIIYALLVLELWFENYKPVFSPKIPEIASSKEKPGILIFNLGGMGDIVMMTPVLSALKNKFPESKITLLTIERSLAVAKNLKEIEEILAIPVAYKLPGIFSFWKIFKTMLYLRRKNFDYLINLREIQTFSGNLKIYLLCLLAGVKNTIGRRKNNFGKFYSVPVWEQKNTVETEVEITAKLLQPLGINPSEINLEIKYPVNDSDRHYVQKTFFENNPAKPLVGINPGAFRPSRRWPSGSWRKLIDLIKNDYPNAKIFLTGEKSEVDISEEISRDKDIIVTTGKLTPGQLASLLEKLDVFISNDSGPMHLAAAVGTKVVGIFGPGDVRFRPAVKKDRYRVVRVEDISCVRPCYKFSCKNPVCLTKITPEVVYQAVREFLS